MPNEIVLDHLHWPHFNETGRVVTLPGSRGTVYTIQPKERMVLTKQVEALNAVRMYKATLWSGAMGCGKSTSLRQVLIDLLIEWAAMGYTNVRVALICETFKALKLRQVPFILSEYGQLGIFNKQDYTFTLHEEYGSNYIALLNADDPEKFKSIDFAAAGVDELTLNREDIFKMVMKRLRWPRIEHTPFFGVTNTTGIGRQWVKETFVDNPRKEYIDDDGKKFPGFFHIHGTIYDNPTLAPSYVTELEQGNEWEVNTFVKGSWDSPEGQFIELIPGIHTVASRPIPADWRKSFGLDFGWIHPTVAGSVAQNPETGQFEHHLVWSRAKMDGRDAKCEIYDYFKEEGHPIESMSIRVADPAGKRSGQTLKKVNTTWALFNSDEARPSFRLREAYKSHGSRVEGWLTLRELLSFKYEWRHDQFGKRYRHVTVPPKLVIHESCWETINSLNELQHDKNKPDDAMKTSGAYGPGRGDDESEMLLYIMQAAYKGKFGGIKTPDPVGLLTPRIRRERSTRSSQKFNWG